MKIRTVIKRLEKENKNLICVGRFWFNILPIKELKIENGINVITGNKFASNKDAITVADAIKVLNLFNPKLEWASLRQIKVNENFCCFCFD